MTRKEVMAQIWFEEAAWLDSWDEHEREGSESWCEACAIETWFKVYTTCSSSDFADDDVLAKKKEKEQGGMQPAARNAFAR